MKLSCATIALFAASSVSAFPINKRIAQVIVESTAQWEQACLTAGGGQQCNPLSVAAFTTLLAAAGPCEQQDAADNMMDLAKQLGSDSEMIRLTQIFTQQPRNSPNSVSVPYCQSAPRNSELNGLFQCQFDGVNPTTFVGGIAVGGDGTIPFGLSSPVSPPQSCPAHPDGGIPDGQQLVNFVQSPGTPQPSNNDNNNNDGGDNNNSDDGDNNNQDQQRPDTPSPSDSDSSGSNSSPAPPADQDASPASSSSFVLQNGKDAQALNAKFNSLTTSSPCSEGDQACVNGEFAQCVSGSFVLQPCGGAQCVALPLVNKPGTSITCDTLDDAKARFAATGVTGGIDGSS